MKSQNSPQNAGFIFVHHIRACGMCTLKARRFLLDRNWSNQEVKEFFEHGMSIERFEKLFGQDAMARQIIKKAKENG